MRICIRTLLFHEYVFAHLRVLSDCLQASGSGISASQRAEQVLAAMSASRWQLPATPPPQGYCCNTFKMWRSGSASGVRDKEPCGRRSAIFRHTAIVPRRDAGQVDGAPRQHRGLSVSGSNRPCCGRGIKPGAAFSLHACNTNLVGPASNACVWRMCCLAV